MFVYCRHFDITFWRGCFAILTGQCAEQVPTYYFSVRKFNDLKDNKLSSLVQELLKLIWTLSPVSV